MSTPLTERAPLERHLTWQNRLRAGAPDAVRMLLGAMLAYAVARGLALHEAYWAVLTALITGRAQAGGTARAGAERLIATVAGAALAASVAAARAWQVDPGILLFAVLAPLCLLVALRPGLRTAPVAALIVLSSGPVAGAGPLGTAIVRTTEIALGALCSLLVAAVVFPARGTARARDSAVTLLHRMAELLRVRGDAARAEPLREQLRADLRELGVLARSSGWRRRAGGPGERLLGALMVLHGDLGFLLRALTRRPLRELDDAHAAALDARLATLAARFDAVAQTVARGTAAIDAEAPPAPAPERGDAGNPIAEYLLRTVGASLASVARVLEAPSAAPRPAASEPG